MKVAPGSKWDGATPAPADWPVPFANRELAALVRHVDREAVHHLVEVTLLRDLNLRPG
ncbi:hypothetical protein [Micromonospora sp. NPDC023814]|uniref:hypothetical protein n=1 Tax=Micromonospora sp. NPDC023814 TaxID=3154596 RepID=UPI0033FCFD8F